MRKGQRKVTVASASFEIGSQKCIPNKGSPQNIRWIGLNEVNIFKLLIPMCQWAGFGFHNSPSWKLLFILSCWIAHPQWQPLNAWEGTQAWPKQQISKICAIPYQVHFHGQTVPTIPKYVKFFLCKLCGFSNTDSMLLWGFWMFSIWINFEFIILNEFTFLCRQQIQKFYFQSNGFQNDIFIRFTVFVFTLLHLDTYCVSYSSI